MIFSHHGVYFFSIGKYYIYYRYNSERVIIKGKAKFNMETSGIAHKKGVMDTIKSWVAHNMHTGQYIKRRIHGVYESHEPGAEIIPRKHRGPEILSYRVYPIHQHTGGIANDHKQHILYKARFILEQSIQAYAYQQEIPCAIGYYEVLAEGYPVIKGEMY